MSNEAGKRPDIGARSQLRGGGDPAMAELADRQHGVVSRTQLLALGFGRRAIQHRIDRGRLHRIHSGVYAVGRSSLDPAGHRMAALLRAGPDAVISHRTAAALWGLMPTAQTMIDVTIPRRGIRSPRAIRIHCSEVLDPADRTTIDGIPVTSLPRTLLDLAPILRPDQLLRVIEQAVRLGRFDLAAVEADVARAPRRGVARLRGVLADYREPAPTRSELERSFVALVERARLPKPQVNVQVAGLEVDFCWPEAWLVVELDGRAFHTSPRQFERDRLRDAQLQRAGYRVLRVTFKRLHEDPAGVIDDIRALIALAA